ncbi:MAG TPA: hypothetical protein PK737_01005 [Bacilli bacterium]|nr:hypothetical protein [Bacilli bacterium]
MESKLAQIKQAITLALKAEQIMVTAVNYTSEGKYNFLQIELDKVNGLDLETIVAATNIINPLIDKLDLIKDSYILDVISKERGED